MPQLRLGVDLQRVGDVSGSVATFRDAYLDRVFTRTEQSLAGLPEATSEESSPRLAGRFAAKEAVMKILRRDDSAVPWRDIEIGAGPAGEPVIALTGRAAALAESQGLSSFTVSLSHDGDYAVASAAAFQITPTKAGPHHD